MEDRTKEKETSEYRKRRVKFIKRIIVTIIILAIIFPTVLSAFLMYKIHILEQEVEQLSKAAGVQVKTGENVIKARTKKAVKQKPTPTPKQEPKKVYLTFDDGPSQQTKRILDILKKEDVKATFFVIGHTDDFSKKMYRRIVKEGHTLGMHSYSHIYSELYKSTASFEKDVEKIQNYLQKVTGITPVYYRFPGGSSYSGLKNPIQDYIQVLNDKGISYIDWNVVDGGNTEKKVKKEDLIANVVNGVSAFSTSIVQMHDSSDKTATADVLPEIIKELKQKGYELLPISSETTPVRHVE